jgi:hypothetical protein
MLPEVVKSDAGFDQGAAKLAPALPSDDLLPVMGALDGIVGNCKRLKSYLEPIPKHKNSIRARD